MVDDQQLARWFYRVELEPGSARQAATATSTAKVAQNISTEEILGLTLLAHGKADEDSFATLRDSIAAEDPTFGCSMADLETHVAAAATLAAVMERRSISAVIASHVILSANWAGLVTPVPDIVSLAHATLAKRAVALRQRSRVQGVGTVDKHVGAIPEFPDDAGALTHQEANSATEPLRDALEALAKASNALATRVDGRMKAADEELDLLWWVFSGVSLTLQEPLSEIEGPGLPLLAGMDIGSLLQFPIPPLSASAIVGRALGSAATVEYSLSDTVTAFCRVVGSLDWVKFLDGGHQLLPVTTSIQQFQAFSGSEAWISSVQRWGVDESLVATGSSLALQLIRERIVVQNI